MAYESVSESAMYKIEAKLASLEKQFEIEKTSFMPRKSRLQALNAERFWIKWSRDLIVKETGDRLRAMVRGIGPVGAKEATVVVNAELFNSLVAELEVEME